MGFAFGVNDDAFGAVFFEDEEEVGEEEKKGDDEGEDVVFYKGNLCGDNDQVTQGNGYFHDFQYANEFGYGIMMIDEPNTIELDLIKTKRHIGNEAKNKGHWV